MSRSETAFPNQDELQQVITKLIDMLRSQYQLRLKRYDLDLADFEARFRMDTATFYYRFEAGELGDAVDFFEWAGMFELRQDLLARIDRLEQAL